MGFLKQPWEFEDDLGVNWRKFKNNLELYIKATGFVQKGKDVQAAVPLHCVGSTHETFQRDEEQKKNVNKITIK